MALPPTGSTRIGLLHDPSRSDLSRNAPTPWLPIGASYARYSCPRTSDVRVGTLRTPWPAGSVAAVSVVHVAPWSFDRAMPITLNDPVDPTTPASRDVL